MIYVIYVMYQRLLSPLNSRLFKTSYTRGIYDIRGVGVHAYMHGLSYEVTSLSCCVKFNDWLKA